MKKTINNPIHYNKAIKFRMNEVENIDKELKEEINDKINRDILDDLGNFGQIVELSRKQILEGYVRPEVAKKEKVIIVVDEVE